MAALQQRSGGMAGETRLDELASRVAGGDLDPFAAADELISG
jgi:LAO/AO transport system kinase